jgi:GAF domain-containing protein
MEAPMQTELEGIMGRFGADTGTIHLEGGILTLKAHVGVPPQLLEIVPRVPIGKGMAGLAAERNEPVSKCNIQADQSRDVQPRAKETGVSGALVVPIRDSQGSAVGALGIGVHRQYEYSESRDLPFARGGRAACSAACTAWSTRFAMRAACCAILALPAMLYGQSIPRTWATASVASLEVPLAQPAFSPVQISEDVYYRLPERVLYKSYPVYVPGREPSGYMERLKQQEPEVAFNPSDYHTAAEWIAAGELVFNAPTSFDPVFFSAADLRDPSFFDGSGMPVAADGTIPFARWIIRKKGSVELGSMSCATCHTRVLNDGRIVPGAPSNNPADREGARLVRQASAEAPDKMLARLRSFARQFEAPWLPADPNAAPRNFSLAQFIEAGEAIPAGVTARANTSMLIPPQIPDLIGVRERRFLDHTGLIRHRDIGDLMRYASLSQDVGAYARYDRDAPPPTPHGSRYGDAQLYALALYLYSLQPPPNPNPNGPAAARGRRIFESEGCPACHTPPLYTTNQLIPADQIGTDPRYTLETRKGTGFYKVPSLKGVWYRGPFEHNGSVATLEDWFDPARLDPSYRPTGFCGYGVSHRRVPGHEFGLKLSSSDKLDLLAFLRML